MIAEVMTGLSLFNSVFSAAKNLKDINDAAVRNEAVADLLQKLVAAMTEYAAAQERVSNLEQEIKRFETWEADKLRYELKDVRDGAMAYFLKEGVEPPEPPHKICAQCYEDRRKSILQTETRVPGMAEVLVCHHCGSEIYVHGQREPEHGGTRSRKGRR